jgi:tetratricopeptide (TPR) repeat protein
VSFVRTTCALGFGLLCMAGMAAQAQSADNIIGELRSGKPTEALHDVTAALRAAPSDARLWTLKGLAERKLAKDENALQSFERAVAIDPKYVPALEGVCDLLYKREPAKAEPYLEQLLDKLPDEPNANGMAAILAYRAGNYTVAAEHFAKAQPAIASSQEGMDAYADTLARLQKHEECERTLSKILQQWPADGWARYNLAALQYKRGANQEASETLQPLLEKNDGPALTLAAALHESIGETPAAVELLRKAIAANPKEPQNYVDFATISFDHNSTQAGIAILNAGLEQLPNAAALYTARGILLMQTADIAGGERDFAEANRLDPSQSFGREAQGIAAIQQHDLPKALEGVKSSLSHSPGSAYLNYMAAQIIKVGAAPGTTQAAECLTYARKAVSLDPKLVGAWDIIAAQEFSAGNSKQAAEASRAALHLDPADQEAVFRLMMVARRNGDSHEVASLVEQLKALKANDHADQQRTDRYRLLEAGETKQAILH